MPPAALRLPPQYIHIQRGTVHLYTMPLKTPVLPQAVLRQHIGHLRNKVKLKDDFKFVAFGGDGGTYDIGLQSLSGAMERVTTWYMSALTTVLI